MERYRVISGMMRDPMNVACVLRELKRVSKRILPPPRPQGTGWAFLTLEFAFEMGLLDRYEDRHVLDSVYRVYGHDESWHVLKVYDDIEVGPFDSCNLALTAAYDLALADGYTVLKDAPWSREVLDRYPIRD